ncbi:MAG: hypothetical protein FWG20_06150, partial [Candidatus Cloacimonetes bacterium]|nr:hypothetical protein [Candidatus Cloacimonadota bacterium]
MKKLLHILLLLIAFSIALNAQLPPTNLNVETGGDWVSLDWDPVYTPEEGPFWLHRSTNYSGLGLSKVTAYPSSFIGVRYSPALLMEKRVAGGYLAAVEMLTFCAHSSAPDPTATANYTIMIWLQPVGVNPDYDNPLIQQHLITHTGEVPLDFHNIILDTPLYIPFDMELWFGARIEWTGNPYPYVHDGAVWTEVPLGPLIGYSNVMKLGTNAWSNWYNGITGNPNNSWIIEGYALDDSGRMVSLSGRDRNSLNISDPMPQV